MPQLEPVVTLSIEWSGPYSLNDVLKEFNRGGTEPEYNGPDYGLYQIYGNHIISGENTLLYIGKAIQQTFSSRFAAHRSWIEREEGISIYLGRSYDEKRHLAGPQNHRPVWVKDLHVAECALIYTYSPNYNSGSITEPPSLWPYQQVIFNHTGRRHRLLKQDLAPDAW